MAGVFQKASVSFQRLLGQGTFDNANAEDENKVAARRRICRIYTGSTGTAGTGVLVGPDVILTNYHVVKDVILGNAEPQSVTVRFDLYDRSSKGREFGLAAPPLISASQYEPLNQDGTLRDPTPDEMDFAILRLAGMPAENFIGHTKRGHFDLSRRYAVKSDKVLHALHFPGGARSIKRSSGSLINSDVPSRIRYSVATLPGSSGGLVLNSLYQPIALHHVGYEKSDGNGGIILEESFNQGITLGDIHAFLKRNGKWPIPAPTSPIMPVTPLPIPIPNSNEGQTKLIKYLLATILALVLIGFTGFGLVTYSVFKTNSALRLQLPSLL